MACWDKAWVGCVELAKIVELDDELAWTRLEALAFLASTAYWALNSEIILEMAASSFSRLSFLIYIMLDFMASGCL